LDWVALLKEELSPAAGIRKKSRQKTLLGHTQMLQKRIAQLKGTFDEGLPSAGSWAELSVRMQHRSPKTFIADIKASSKF
jgi:hypothetical protein